MLRKILLSSPILRASLRRNAGNTPFNYKDAGKNWSQFCKIGNSQSPIDFPSESKMAPSKDVKINLSYNILKNVKLINKKTTLSLSANLGRMSIVTKDRELEYQGVEFHFHIPSEHTFIGKYRDMEMHIVHDLAKGPAGYKYSKAVLGVLFSAEQDKENPFLKSLNVDTLAECPEVNLKDLVKSTSNKTYHYDGSLTTPPCSEIVHWVVIPEVLQMSKQQMKIMRNQWEQHLEGCCNNRHTCPISGRKIYIVDNKKL